MAHSLGTTGTENHDLVSTVVCKGSRKEHEWENRPISSLRSRTHHAVHLFPYSVSVRLWSLLHSVESYKRFLRTAFALQLIGESNSSNNLIKQIVQTILCQLTIKRMCKFYAMFQTFERGRKLNRCKFRVKKITSWTLLHNRLDKQWMWFIAVMSRQRKLSFHFREAFPHCCMDHKPIRYILAEVLSMLIFNYIGMVSTVSVLLLFIFFLTVLTAIGPKIWQTFFKLNSTSWLYCVFLTLCILKERSLDVEVVSHFYYVLKWW